MAKKKTQSKTPKFLRHRFLVGVEAVLIASVLKDFANGWVKARPELPNGVKVAFVMAATVGILGVLFVVLEKAARIGVSKTHEVAQALPLPAPVLLLHLAALTGLFYLYAWLQHMPVWPM